MNYNNTNKIRRKKVSSSNNTTKSNESSTKNTNSRSKSRRSNSKKDKFRFFRCIKYLLGKNILRGDALTMLANNNLSIIFPEERLPIDLIRCILQILLK